MSELKKEIVEIFKGYREMINAYNMADGSDYEVGLPKCIDDIDEYIKKDKCKECPDRFSCRKMTTTLFVGMFEYNNPITKCVINEMTAIIIHLVLEARTEEELNRISELVESYENLIFTLNHNLKFVGSVSSEDDSIQNLMKVFKAKLN